MQRLSFALLVPLLLVAGCLGSEPGSERHPLINETKEESVEPPGATPEPEPEPVLERATLAGAVEQIVAVGMPCIPDLGPGCVAGFYPYASLDFPQGVPLRAVLTANWTPTTPLGNDLLFILEPASGEKSVSSTGSSPFVWDVPVDALHGGAWRLWVWPSHLGATALEVVVFEISFEYVRAAGGPEQEAALAA